MTALKNLLPFSRGETGQGLPSPSHLGDLHREIDHVFDSLWHGSLLHWPSKTIALTGELSLKIDVAETPKSYVITAEMPGVSDKDVNVTLTDGILTITGEKREEHVTDDKTVHRVERRYGSFRRSLTLPVDADENGVTAKIDKGVLTVDITKSKTADKATRRIEVKTI